MPKIQLNSNPHVFGIGLGITLLISLVINVLLYNSTRNYYSQLNAVRLDPLNLDAYPEAVWPASETDRIKVLFLGDSRAAQWPAPAEAEHFQFLNRGYGAQTSSQVRLRYDAHIMPLHPTIIVLQVCINDLKTIPLFPEQKAAIVAKCQRNIAEIVQRSQQLGAKIILTTVFPLGNVPLIRRLVWSDAVAQAIAEVNTYLLTLANDQVLIFDSAEVLAATDGRVRPEYQVDLLHINARGYAALNQKLVPVLQKFANVQ